MLARHSFRVGGAKPQVYRPNQLPCFLGGGSPWEAPAVLFFGMLDTRVLIPLGESGALARGEGTGVEAGVEIGRAANGNFLTAAPFAAWTCTISLVER
mmetsp:Transcript_15582/g.37376  ORF Transcript_15582/g.37376 Transcript_15582/m.37376 type:complete len:98 (+) Transcript_15582:217-510(+)